MNLKEFLSKYLFESLGIMDISWEPAPDGIIAGGMGLSLRVDDLLKIGQLLLDCGVYKGRRLISVEYIKEATEGHIIKTNERDVDKKIYSGKKYGYQIHVDIENNYRFDGAFGQVCFISPVNNVVVVVTSTGSKIEDILKHIYGAVLDENLGNCELIEIVDKLQHERIHRNIKWKESYYGIYKLSDNPIGAEKICIKAGDSSQKDEENSTLELILDSGEVYGVDFSLEHSCEGEGLFIKDIQVHEQRYVTYAQWVGKNRKRIIVCYTETPYILEYLIEFVEGGMFLNFKINCSFTLENFKATGK